MSPRPAPTRPRTTAAPAGVDVVAVRGGPVTMSIRIRTASAGLAHDESKATIIAFIAAA